MIYIDSIRKKTETIRKLYPNALVFDVTSHSLNQLIKFSPFYPHNDIPVPFSSGMTASCVEAIWQGLKVFEESDVDTSLFTNRTMKNLKRTVRKYGKPLGHRKGVNGKELLDYINARKEIYAPAYKWVLENKIPDLVERMRKANKSHDIVLLDYETNCDINNGKKPLSHAYLIKAYIEGLYPYNENKIENSFSETKQLTLF